MFASAGFSPAEMNAFSITITTEGASFAGDGSRITNLMPRITTVTANGGFSSTQNKVRIYYRPEELNNTAPAAAIMSGWVKYSGSAGDIIADINNDGLLEAAKLAFLTPDAAGIEDGIHYVEFHNLCSFSSFAYISSTASITSTLPVDMLHFTAVANGAATFLQWTTTAEQQNKGFTVERSVDGGNWNKIGFVASKAFNGYSSSNQY